MIASSNLCSLPEDVLTDILLSLPVKSLLRCKSVCKEWHAIISSPSFIKKHFNHDSNLTRLVLYCYGDKPPETDDEFCTYSYFPNETLERHEVPDNLLLWGEIIYFRGPCNGIFCIYITKNKFALWNPTTRRLRLIQCCPSYVFDDMGFGMDPLTGDFKIVLILSQSSVSPCFAVYTSSNDSWKYLEEESIRDSDAYITGYISGNNTYLNGFYYWLKMKIGVHFGSAILAFDMHNEIFEETTIPEIVVNGEALHLFNDSLALVSFDPFCWDKRTEIWLMEGKGCWTKFLSVVLHFECLMPYGFWGWNKILVSAFLNNNVELMVYDLDSHSARQLKVENVFDGSEILPIFFKESLFSLKGKDGIPDHDTQSAEALEFLGYEGPNTKITCHDFRAGFRSADGYMSDLSDLIGDCGSSD